MVKADSLSEEKREAILHALGKLKQRVLWKWENDTLPNQPPNVFIRKWMPQREILCELKTKQFTNLLVLIIGTLPKLNKFCKYYFKFNTF